MQYKARKHYETYYQKIAEAEKDPAVVKGENADGKTYILEKDKLAMVVGKNNEYIIFHQHDGNWSRMRPNGELELTYSDGAWVRVMPDGERIAVKASGNTNIAYHQGDVSEDIITSLKTPEVPAQVEGFASVPQKPVKPKKLGTVWARSKKPRASRSVRIRFGCARTDLYLPASFQVGEGGGTR